MGYICPKHGALVEEGAEAVEEMPVYWWKKVPLCPKCLTAGVKGKSDAFTVHKLEET